MNSTMFNAGDILETIRMIQDECLDIRTTTMGISLLDCIDPDINKACDKVYDKITRKAEKLVETGEKIEKNTAFRLSTNELPLHRLQCWLLPARKTVRSNSQKRCKEQLKPAVSTLSAVTLHWYTRDSAPVIWN